MSIEIRSLGRIFGHSLGRPQRPECVNVYRQVHASSENFSAGRPRSKRVAETGEQKPRVAPIHRERL